MSSMDVTLKEIEEVEFTERFRGYDVEEVKDFLDRVGHTMARLLNELRSERMRSESLEAELAEARSAVPVAPVAAPVADDLDSDGEVEQASRTLMLAKRTAEAAIAEARAEANQLLSEARDRADTTVGDARAESERIMRDAQNQRDDLVRRAKEDADREFGSQKARFEEECRHLEERRRHTGEEVQALEDRVAEYRRDLESVVDRLRKVLDDPDALVKRPPMTTTTFEEPAPAVPQAPIPSAPPTAPPAAAPDMPAAAITEPPLDEPPATTAPSWHDAAPVAEVSAIDVEAPTTAPATFDPQPTVVEPLAPTPEPAGGADPWGPGSWSNVDGGDSFEPASFDEGVEHGGAAQPTAAYDAFATGQTDRYLRELDEAVHGEEVESDDAMNAFFESDEPSRRRRGRRR